jgi:starch-binding outer membrane protein, SusD/RagB family
MKILNIPLALIVAFILFVGGSFSCKEFLDVGLPKTEVISKAVFENPATATSAMLSVYGSFMQTSATSMGSSVYLGQAADELISYATPPFSNYYRNDLVALTNNEFWKPYYDAIYRANIVLEGVENSPSLTEDLKNQLKGEAVFVRAFFHFYLFNLFGDVPYLTTADYKVNNLAPRMSREIVYSHIVEDFKMAKTLLTDKFPNAANQPSVERVRPNRVAAQAMLARTYLYMKEWEKAGLEANDIIQNTSTYELLNDLNLVFKKNSKETIWQLMSSDQINYTNGYEGYSFILNAAPGPFGSSSVSLSDQVWNSFEANDKRKTNWVGTFMNYHYPFKYRVKAIAQPITEYSMVIRLAEIFLIRAEALAEQNKLAEAIQDLDAIRGRAGISKIAETRPEIQKAELLSVIYHERQVELFTEWGHRWLDLKRTDRADVVLKPIKGASWQTTDRLFPIPKAQMDNSPAFRGAQNPGYN